MNTINTLADKAAPKKPEKKRRDKAADSKMEDDRKHEVSRPTEYAAMRDEDEDEAEGGGMFETSSPVSASYFKGSHSDSSDQTVAFT
jgi:hypothetical protein